ncbi:MAG: acyl dehydratase [Oleispira sp.]|jgi:acyl dehydratase
MNQATRVQLTKTPSTLNQYSRALFSSALKTTTPVLPSTQITLSDISAEANKVAKYSEVCGFKQDSNQLPMTFPHLLAFPLHLELMLLRDFPFAVMGMVHVRNEITQHRAINLLEKMDITCFLSDIRKTDKGYDIDIKTEVHITGQLVWESISTNLTRQKTDIIPTAKSLEPMTLPEYPYKEFWHLSADLGRRYALVSGDSNPIHLFSLSAKLFGFKGHIAHGMWSKARIVAALYNRLDSEACKIVVDFKLPVFLPASVQLNYDIQDKTIAFDLRDKSGTKPHLKGSIEALPSKSL